MAISVIISTSFLGNLVNFFHYYACGLYLKERDTVVPDVLIQSGEFRVHPILENAPPASHVALYVQKMNMTRNNSHFTTPCQESSHMDNGLSPAYSLVLHRCLSESLLSGREMVLRGGHNPPKSLKGCTPDPMALKRN